MASTFTHSHLYTTTQLIEQTHHNIICANKMFVLIVHMQCGGKMDYCQKFMYELYNKKFIELASFVKREQTNRNDKNQSILHIDKNEPLVCDFHSDLGYKLRIGIDVSFPVPLYIQSIIDTIIKTLSKEQLHILQLASIICKAKGNIALKFEQNIIEECIDNKLIGKSSLVHILSQLCDMKLIYPLQNNDQNILCKQCCVNINQCINTHLFPGYIRQYEIKNNLIIPIEIQSVIFNYFDKYLIQFYENESESNTYNYVSAPMPTINSLLQKPILSTIPYKKGIMYKRGINFLGMCETKRLFVFKHDTLYWIKENRHKKYPAKKIHINELLQLKREDIRSITVKTERKWFVLRCRKKKDMYEWIQLLTERKSNNSSTESDEEVLTLNNATKVEVLVQLLTESKPNIYKPLEVKNNNSSTESNEEVLTLNNATKVE
eukprot:124954_1